MSGNTDDPQPRFSSEQLTDWINVFDTVPTTEDDGALTKRQIMKRVGCSEWKASREIDARIEAGLWEWVRVRRVYKGVENVVTAYRPKRTA